MDSIAASTVHAPLVIDVAGTALTPDDRRRLAHPLVGGCIFFGRNFESRAQLTALSAAIKSLRPDILLCVDHEGGRVQRFRSDGLTHLPPMRAFGALWADDAKQPSGHGALRATAAATAAGFVLGAELRACGIDFSFTPVLDLDHADDERLPDARALAAGAGVPRASRSSVIGDRAFDRDPRVVAMLAKSLLHGLLQAGVGNCGKHFPGHGHVAADSHTDAPVDRRSLKAILADDALPYAWLANSLTAVMPAHVVYSRVDRRPAGYSPRWLQDILRGQIGFDGAVFSDDLSMEAARRIDGVLVGFADAAVAALNAGCDLVLLCNQSLGDGRALDDLLDDMDRAQTLGRWVPSERSAARCRALLPVAPALAWDNLQREPTYQRALALLPAGRVLNR